MYMYIHGNSMPACKCTSKIQIESYVHVLVYTVYMEITCLDVNLHVSYKLIAMCM